MVDEPSMDQAFLEKLTEIVEENLGNEQFGVEDLAREAGMSRSKIHRKLHELTKQSTTQFVREIRLRHAMDLLRKKVSTVTEVAYRVGFNSPTYFSTCFNEYYGFPPGDVAQHTAEEIEKLKPADFQGTTGQPGSMVSTQKNLYTIAALIILITLTGYYLYQNGNNNTPPRQSVAVIPIYNLTGDSDNEYFTDGIHDALIGELGQISGLRVISRTSTLQFKDPGISVPEIAARLGVNNIVEGSVYSLGDSVRIQVQLIGVEPDERNLWTRSYTRELSGVLPLLSEVTRQIAGEIQVALTEEEALLLSNRREVNPEAYKAYLRGNYHLNIYTQENYEKGIAYLLEATRIDPADPLPWARLALGYNTAGHGIIPPDDAYKKAQFAAERALKLDQTHGEVHLARALVDLYSHWDWEAARRGFENTFKFDPNIAEAHAHNSWFIMLNNGTADEILEEAQLAMDLDPFTPLYPVYKGFEAWLLGQHDLAIASVETALELDPDFAYGWYVLGSAYAAKGMYEEAIEAHQKASDLNRQWVFSLGHTYAAAGMETEAMQIAKELASDPKPIDQWGLAEIYTTLGDKEEAMRWVQSGYDTRFSWIPWMEWNPHFAPLRDDPRFQNLLELMNVESRGALNPNL